MRLSYSNGTAPDHEVSPTGRACAATSTWSTSSRSRTGPCTVRTLHPQHIGTESLIRQEDLDGPILALGLEKGQTGSVAPRNRDDV